jgi:DNA-binding winged helix-turn-helix (wHTH) protein
VSESTSGIYDFGTLRLDTRARRLFRAGSPLPLTPKSFDLLRLLVENGGRALSKAELLEALWPDVRVEEGNLSFQVAVLRKTLGPEEARWIETVPRFGYRCSAAILRLAACAEDQSAGPTPNASESGIPLTPIEPVLRLPAPRTALVGRDHELAALRSLLLTDDVRLVT